MLEFVGTMSHEVTSDRTFTVPKGALVTSASVKYHSAFKDKRDAIIMTLRESAVSAHTRFLENRGIEFDWNQCTEQFIHSDDGTLGRCSIELTTWPDEGLPPEIEGLDSVV